MGSTRSSREVSGLAVSRRRLAWTGRLAARGRRSARSRSSWSKGRSAASGKHHLCSVLQAVEVARSDQRALSESLHGRFVIGFVGYRDVLQMNRVAGAVDNVHKRLLTVVLNHRCRQNLRRRQRIHEQARIDKLIWEQRAVRIAEARSKLDGAGRGIDLVIEGQ